MKKIFDKIKCWVNGLLGKKLPEPEKLLPAIDPIIVTCENTSDEIKECTIFGSNRFFHSDAQGDLVNNESTPDNYGNDNSILLRNGYEDTTNPSDKRYGMTLWRALGNKYFKAYRLKVITDDIKNLRQSIFLISEKSSQREKNGLYSGDMSTEIHPLYLYNFMDAYQSQLDILDMKHNFNITGAGRIKFTIQPKSKIIFSFFIGEDERGKYKKPKNVYSSVIVISNFETLPFWTKFKLLFKKQINPSSYKAN